MEFTDNNVASGKIVLVSATYSTTVSRQCDITIAVYAQRSDYGGASDGSYSVSAPDFYPSSGSGGLYLSDGNWVPCGQYSRTVTTDGNGIANISITAKINVRSPSSGWFTSVGTLTRVSCGVPPSLAKPSQVSCNSSVQMGHPLLITIDRDDAYCTHTVEYSFGGSTGTIGTSVGSSVQWDVPDLASYCPNATSGTCTITCKTNRSGTYLGKTTTTTELTVPDPTRAKPNRETLPMGSATEINVARGSTNFRTDVYLNFSGRQKIYSGKDNAFAWTPEYSLAAKIPNLTVGTATLETETYNGTALVGTESTTIKLQVPENETTRPKLSELLVSPVSSLPAQFDGLYMRGKTGLQAKITASSEYSTIATYTVAAGRNAETSSSSTVILDIINSDGTVTVTATVTDARGFRDSKSTTISVIPYSPPKVVPYTGYSNIICERCTKEGALSPNGTYLAIRAGKRFTSVILDGKEQNGCTLRYRHKKSSAPSYGDWITLLGEGSADSEISTIISGLVDSLSTSYQIELSVTDKLGEEHRLRFSVMTEAISFVLYDGVDGAAFGKYPEQPHVIDIASHMTLRVRGDLVVDGEQWKDLGIMEPGVTPSGVPHGRHESTGCYCRKENGNHVLVAFNVAFEISGTFITVNKELLPENYRPPRMASSICVMDGGLASVSVTPTGSITIDWAKKTTEQTVPVDWIDGYIDYYTE